MATVTRWARPSEKQDLAYAADDVQAAREHVLAVLTEKTLTRNERRDLERLDRQIATLQRDIRRIRL